MRLQEAADLLGVHYQTAYGWVRGGQLPARKIRRGYEVSEADVQALAAARQVGRQPASRDQGQGLARPGGPALRGDRQTARRRRPAAQWNASPGT